MREKNYHGGLVPRGIDQLNSSSRKLVREVFWHFPGVLQGSHVSHICISVTR